MSDGSRMAIVRQDRTRTNKHAVVEHSWFENLRTILDLAV